ncbi:MAG: FAD-dependent oxidoreductase [Spirochaetes bacterium]|nr:FAD-dependent oxidoreductase [Spirochaetota bacterium]
MKKHQSRAMAYAALPAAAIPVIASVDVLIAGGSCAAVAAAVRAVQTKARVFLAASRTYFGEDAAGTLRLCLEDGESAPGTPAEKVWGTEKYVRPAVVKKRLEEMLVTAGVEFLYSSIPTDIIVDKNGRAAGAVFANRAGRMAVIAKTVIDATENGMLARIADAEFRARTTPRIARWVTIAEKQMKGPGIESRVLNLPLTVYDKMGRAPIASKAQWFEYTIALPEHENSSSSRTAIEQIVRERTYHPTQLYASEIPFIVPDECIVGNGSSEHAAYRSSLDRLWILSGAVDMSFEDASKLMRPVSFMKTGTLIGAAAAAEASMITAPSADAVSVYHMPGKAAIRGTIREARYGLRNAIEQGTIEARGGLLPVLGAYDVVVVGGGTSGAPAGIAAARMGAKTLVIETLYGLGGVSTLGMIGSYWKGNRAGFTKAVPENPIETRMEWYRHELRSAGADIWFGVISFGALMEKNRITGIVVATSDGPALILAQTVIDATGNADIARAAGAPTMYVEDDFAFQESHFARREVGSSYTNGGRPSVADDDPHQLRSALTKRSETPFDWSPIFNTRERRRVVGEYVLDWLDQITERTFPDSICLGKSDYDSHGYQIHPFFLMRPARVKGGYDKQFTSYVPYRSIIPKGIDGMLVIGLGMSAHRDAIPIVRMQPDLHNLGFAAGTAAAMSVRNRKPLRSIDIRALQRHLVYIGNLPASVIDDADSFPMPKEKVISAVIDVLKDFLHLEILLAQPEDSLPLLRTAFASADGTDKVRYAEILALLGDACGLDCLIDACRHITDTSTAIGTRVTQVRSQSDPDDVERIIWALGFIRDERAAQAIISLADHIPPADFLKYRAFAVSLGRIGDTCAVESLTEFLSKYNDMLRKQEDTVGGTEDAAEIFEGKESSGMDTVPPPSPTLDDLRIRTLITAVALFRCGDRTLAADTLNRIGHGWSGPHAECAQQVLSATVHS